MTQSSFPFSSTTPGDAGPYSADFFAQLLNSIHGQSLSPDASVISSSGNGTDAALNVEETSPQSAQVLIHEGDALVNGYYYRNDASPALQETIASNVSGNPRIDIVALEIDFTAQEVRVFIVQGTPAGSPVAPTLTQSGVIWQVALAHVAVADSFAVITDADIDNTVREDAHAWLPQEGGTGISTIINPLVKGDVLLANSANVLTAENIADFTRIVGDPAQASGVSILDLRPHKIRSNTEVSINGTRTLLTFLSADNVNPASFIGGPTANQFTLVAGTYIVWAAIAFGVASGVATSTWVSFWVADSTATAVALAQSVLGNVPNDNTTEDKFAMSLMLPQLLVSDGVQLFEVYAQGWRAATASLRTISSAVGVWDAGDPFSQEFVFIRVK